MSVQKLRKIFNYDNLSESKISYLSRKNELYPNTISACGCMFYKIVDNKLQLLLIKYDDPNWPLLDDFGGQIDEDDNTIIDAICRETSEETNNIITSDFIKDWIENDANIKTFYNKTSKYYSKIIETKNNFYPDTEIFGDFEITDKIKRTVKWFDYAEIKSTLAHRLAKNNDLIEYLDKIVEQLCEKIETTNH